nr:hypothetical protein [Tanacetum cinerariifolium]
KDYAKNHQKSVKIGQYRTQDWKSTSKAGSKGIFCNNQANEAKCQKIESSRAILSNSPKLKSKEKGKIKVKG